MNGATTATAAYSALPVLTVQSTPAGAAITGTNGGTANYTAPIAANSAVQLTAPVVANYNFVSWTVGGTVSYDSVAAFNITANTTALATYSVNQIQYSLAVNSTPAQAVAITGTNPGSTNYTATLNSGATVTLTAPAVAGYNFTSWTVTGATAAGTNPVSFTMTAPATALATYTQIPTYTLAVNSTPYQGAVITGTTGATGNSNYTTAPLTSGAVVTITAPATLSGYNFANWAVTGVTATGTNPVSFTMTANATALATYTASGYTLNVNWGLTVSGKPFAPTAVAITGTPNNYGGSANYSMSGITSGSTMTLTAPNQFTVQTNGTNGTFAWAKGAYTQAGQVGQYGGDYMFDHWTVNGATVSVASTITVTTGGTPIIPMVYKTVNVTVTANTTVVAIYKPLRKGDINGDGVIDIFDFGFFAADFGKTRTHAAYNPLADFNNDSVIDIFDFGFFASVFGTNTL
jgi:hypothetical protein